MANLTAAINSGLRPLGVKASLQRWLGVPISLTNGEFWRDYFGASSFTGKSVTVEQTLGISTAKACVQLISETGATLPCGFYERKPDGSREPAPGHRLYTLLHDQPNADMTAVSFWQATLASMLLRGVGNIEKVYSRDEPISINFLMPDRLQKKAVSRNRYEWRYRDDPTSPERTIPEERLMRIPAFSLDGVNGISPVQYGANVFSTAIETDRASAETFQSALRAPGLVTMDMTLRKDQREEIRGHVKKVSAEGGVMVLEKGASFQKIAFDPVDAELLASRAWNVEEICRWFRVDPAMVGHGQKDSNWGTGLEEKMSWFISLTLRHWCVRIEQAIRKDLLKPAERLRYFAEFGIEGLLRGNSAARSAFYQVMIRLGVMTRDECRKLENLPPMGGNAAVLTCESNMLPLDLLGHQNDAGAAAMRDALVAFLGVEHLASKGAP